MTSASAGRWDMHCHTAPCLLPRWGTALDVAAAAARRGYAGIVILSHHAATVREAAIAQANVPGVRVIGGVVMNHACGGISRDAVRVHLCAGARLFSLPTLDATAHVRTLGAGRTLKGEIVAGLDGAGIAVAGGGALCDELRYVLDLLARHGAVLYSGHIDAAELRLVVAETAARGLPLIVNHPYFLASPDWAFWDTLPANAAVQFAAVNVPGDARVPPISAVREVVRRVGAARCMLGSQASAPVHPLDRLDAFHAELAAAGLSSDAIAAIAAASPARFVHAHLAEQA